MNANDVTAIVLAGGLGTRVSHLLPGIPKPMALVAGKPFLEWVVRYLARHGIDRVILSTGYLANTIAAHFHPSPIPEVHLTCCPEPSALGTAGGFLHAATQVLDPPQAWLVLNGDSLVFADLTAMLADLAEPTVAGVLLGVAVPDAGRYGGLAGDDRQILTGFTEKRPGAGVVNAGIYLLRHRLLAQIPHLLGREDTNLVGQPPLSFECDVFPALIQAGFCLKIHPTEAAFLDIGTPETLAIAEAFIQHHWPWR